jgi:hypothetical protein
VQALASFPHIQAHRSRMLALPKVAEFLAARARAPLSLNNKSAFFGGTVIPKSA